MNRLFLYTMAFISALIPRQILAYSASDGITAVSGGLQNMFGDSFQAIASGVAGRFIPVVTSIAILSVIISGFVLTFSQSEEQMTTARRALIWSLIAIALAALAYTISAALVPSGIGGGVSYKDVSAEIMGVADWISSIAAVVAILMLIVSGIRAVTSYGSDEGVAQIRRATIAAIAGFTIIAMRYPLKRAIADDRTPGTFLHWVIIPIVNSILGFVGLLAVIFIVIAGIMMIVNVGNDEQYQKAKGLILRVGIGLLVIIASAAIVNMVFI